MTDLNVTLRLPRICDLPDCPCGGMPESPAVAVSAALEHLRRARDLLAAAPAPKALDRTRAAIASAKGALRHADLAPYRRDRQGAPDA